MGDVLFIEAYKRKKRRPLILASLALLLVAALLAAAYCLLWHHARRGHFPRNPEAVMLVARPGLAIPEAYNLTQLATCGGVGAAAGLVAWLVVIALLRRNYHWVVFFVGGGFVLGVLVCVFAAGIATHFRHTH